ncbi:MAG: T9SS type A sorting domain-containing protein, partial [Candidatus Latescibacteria bacterium]|nr:T9SS type A sorting domain-containing protein [Candidatus Latescibacterota bacterium]
TGNGVSRFDGATWKNYTIEDGLANNWVKCIAVAPDGAVWFGTPRGVSRFVGEKDTAIKEASNEWLIPAKFSLFQNTPNPFNPLTMIAYKLSKPGYVQLIVYNLLGQRIRTLLKERRERGKWEVLWDGRDDLGQEVSSGVYLYRLAVDGEEWTETKKMVLIR